jgi:hypothetical protein
MDPTDNEEVKRPKTLSPVLVHLPSEDKRRNPPKVLSKMVSETEGQSQPPKLNKIMEGRKTVQFRSIPAKFDQKTTAKSPRQAQIEHQTEHPSKPKPKLKNTCEKPPISSDFLGFPPMCIVNKYPLPPRPALPVIPMPIRAAI